MKRIGFRRPSPPMVVAFVALMVALAGTSYAAIQLPANSVGAKQLKKNAVTGKKVKNRSLKAADFAAGQLPQGEKGDKGDPGPAGATNVTVRQGPGSANDVDTANCNPGERAVGGGGNAPANDAVLWMSEPAQKTGTPTGWSVAAVGASGPSQAQAYVICAAP